MKEEKEKAKEVIITQAPPSAVVRTVKLTVNGRRHHIQVEQNWPLRDVLRQKLGLK